VSEYTREALGQIIRERRTAKPDRNTQREFGEDAGYRGGPGGRAVAISRIEAGLTEPNDKNFAGVAAALGMSPEQLRAEAQQRTLDLANGSFSAGSNDRMASPEHLRFRMRRIQGEVKRRTDIFSDLGNAFNDAQDRAQTNFLLKFIAVAPLITSAVQPEPSLLENHAVEAGDVGPKATADTQLRAATFGVSQAIGTASTGMSAGTLSGAAASRAALAWLGSGSFASARAAASGGRVLLGGMVTPPGVLLLALGGVALMVKRSRKQQRELSEKLDDAEADLELTERGFEALEELLPVATETLAYIDTYAGHALDRWVTGLGPEFQSWIEMPPDQRETVAESATVEWEALSESSRERYADFIAITASQLSIAAISVESILVTHDESERERLVSEAREVLTQATAKVRELV